jgi:hypothetical protein
VPGGPGRSDEASKSGGDPRARPASAAGGHCSRREPAWGFGWVVVKPRVGAGWTPHDCLCRQSVLH